jgi:16S rRNA (cytosine967-C5)-methyltransferase
MTDRELAYDILYDIHINGELCHKALKKHLDNLDKSGKATVNKPFVTRLVKGVTKRYITLTWAESIQAGRPVSKIKPPVRIILAMGLYQGCYMSVPVSAACNEAVKLAKKHKLSGLSGFVNAVLRGFFRSSNSMEDFIEKNVLGLSETKKLEIIYSCSEWMIKKFIALNGKEQTINMLQSFYKEKKLTVYKLNNKVSDEELEQSLKKDEVSFLKSSLADDAYELELNGQISSLEAFKKGWIIVQDISSMLASQVIPAISNAKVLDLCAAPGGKTIHLASLLSDKNGEIIARDVSDSKCRLIEENCKRTGTKNVKTEVADACELRTADLNKYDIVVADLPCSGLGVIGKKPDIKYKTKPEDINSLALLQRKILDNAMQYVKPGGYLAYSTCTVTYEENQQNADYIRQNGSFEPIDFTKSLDKTMHDYLQLYGYLQILPDELHDGFFIALFRKK